MVACDCTPSTWEVRAEGAKEQVILSCIENLRLAWDSGSLEEREEGKGGAERIGGRKGGREERKMIRNQRWGCIFFVTSRQGAPQSLGKLWI